MPEGPEICLLAKEIAPLLQGKILVVENKYRKVEKVDTKGKRLFIEFDDSTMLLFRFGLTGTLEYSNSAVVLKHVRACYPNKEKTKTLYFIDQLNYGKAEFVDKVKGNQTLECLAPDVLTLSSAKIFGLLLEKEKSARKIVSALVDQKMIVSGIGNYLVSEILYDAKISPYRKLRSLSIQEFRTLAEVMDNLPKLFLQQLMSGKQKKFSVYHEAKDPKGNKVVGDIISQKRTTWWVPSVQK